MKINKQRNYHSQGEWLLQFIDLQIFDVGICSNNINFIEGRYSWVRCVFNDFPLNYRMPFQVFDYLIGIIIAIAITFISFV